MTRVMSLRVHGVHTLRTNKRRVIRFLIEKVYFCNFAILPSVYRGGFGEVSGGCLASCDCVRNYCIDTNGKKKSVVFFSQGALLALKGCKRKEREKPKRFFAKRITKKKEIFFCICCQCTMSTFLPFPPLLYFRHFLVQFLLYKK